MAEVIAFVLAGGRSQRFGADKARALWRGKPLLLHAVEGLATVADRVVVIADRADKYLDLLPKSINTIADAAPNLGPLEGLRTALGYLPQGAVAVMAPCDVVGVDPQWLTELVHNLTGQPTVDGALATAFRQANSSGKGAGWEPLHGAYRQELLAFWQQSLPATLRAPHQLLTALADRALAVGLPRQWHAQVHRIDTPADLDAIAWLATERVQFVEIIQRESADAHSRHDAVAIEQPLEIRFQYGQIGGRQRCTFAVTLRTPGHDADLIAGLLFAEGVLRERGDLLRIGACDTQDHESAVWSVDLAPQVVVPEYLLGRRLAATAACGLCGKGSLDALFPQRPRPLSPQQGTLPWAQLCELPLRMRAAQTTFDETGGLHAAAIFNQGGDLLCLREDIGRHNAVDKAIGHLWQQGRLAEANVLMLSGRAGFELVQKAAMAQIAVVAAIGAPSSLAVDLAQEAGITLVGFLRGQRGNVYAHGKRFVA